MVIGLAFAADDPPVELELPLPEPPEPPQAVTSAATAMTHAPVKCLPTRMSLPPPLRAQTPGRTPVQTFAVANPTVLAPSAPDRRSGDGHRRPRGRGRPRAHCARAS